ncbi:hypothetical protein EHS25_000448 [Saitozyma podzolica]|uniref:Pericentrin/AKAP-450 centrosomal targeting domain-containing protein n=1 Tax=Saitozyma podzolica TaxID=1890683 RepID=A0A427YWM6_9TREE|nr:hypothetical protein EHS25_000448 [Saitozyma podzolica]
MATAYPLDTPERVLKRVHQLELQELELPSLPSFQHDIDYESEGYSAGETSLGSVRIDRYDEASEIDPATPHPLRKASEPSTGTTALTALHVPHSPVDSTSTSSSSPFPPLASTEDDTSFHEARTAALTSTPYSQASRTRQYVSDNDTRSTFRYGSALERARSVTEGLGSSVGTGREKWHTPGEMSGSFSGDEIRAEQEEYELGPEMSLPLPLSDVSNSFEKMAETPLTRRLSASKHVLLHRPGRRSQSIGTAAGGAFKLLPSAVPAPITEASSPSASINSDLPLAAQDRVPSLSESEVSVPETHEATTPEAPGRLVSGLPSSVPRPNLDHDARPRPWEQDLPDAETATFEYPASDMYDSAQEGIEATSDRASPLDHSGSNLSPIKAASTPGFSTMSTPGVGREPPTHEDSYNSALHHEYPSTALQDVTGSHQDFAAVPFTPSPVGMSSKLSDISTPRAPLDDAERRKSHVLAVLQSTGLPSRTRLAVRGTPHPLRRVSMPPSSDSITEEGTPLSRNTPTATPGSRVHLTVNSSHISGGNESFVSIASSADLTSDRRAATAHKRLSRGNTSFPTILLPTTGASPASGGSLRGLSEGRADGIKIHKHLNAMNKQLLDTNADLAREAEAWRDEVDRMRGILQDAGVEFEDVDVAANISQGGRDGRSFSGLASHPARRHSNDSDLVTSQLARLNAPTGGLSRQTQVSSPDGAADNHDVTLQEMVGRLEDLEAGLDEKDRIISSLEEKLSRRPADTPDDQAVAEQVEELTRQLEEAERARVALHEEFALKTQQHAEKFGEICQGFEEQVKGLERELAASRGEADRLRADKSRLEALASTGDLDAREIEWRKQVRDLEVAVGRAQEETKNKMGEVESLKKRFSQAHDEKRLQQREAVELQARVRSLETQLDEAITELEQAKADLAETQGAQEAAENEVGQLDNDVAELQQANDDQQAELQRQQEEIQELVERLQQVESQDGHQTADEEMATELEQMRLELEEVAASMAEKDSEIEELRGKLEVASLAASTGRTRSSPVGDQRSGHVDLSAINDQASFIEAIQDRLDEAYREIGRLKHELAATPHRKSDIETRDAKITALEREKASLSDRLAATRAGMSSPQTTILQSAGSPFTRPTPFLHRAIASLKTPKTPGPLKETTLGDSNEPVLQAQIEYLQTELHRANDQLDSNFSRLEAAGLGGVALAEKLAAAEERIAELEDEIRALIQRNKASLALVSAQKREAQKEDESRLQISLAAVHDQLDQLRSDTAAERARLQRDNGRLQDLVSEIRLKSQKESESLRAEMERVAEEMRAEVKEAESGMFAATKERNVMEQELQASGDRVRQLERDLRDLERKQTRASRDQKDINAPEQDKADEVRSLQASLQEANAVSERLRVSLDAKTHALEQAENRVSALQRERERVTKDLTEFERDLRAARLESQRFGAELQRLKLDQEAATAKQGADGRLERECRSAQDKLRVLRLELDEERATCQSLERWREEHKCGTGAQLALEEQRARFKAQTRDLAAQIRYLKAKFTRESIFRNGLALQKRYFLLLVGGMSLNEQATLKAIASMGFPVPEPPRPKRTLKAVGLAVLGLIRAKNSAARWKEERAMKAGAVANHTERRRVSSRT